MDISTQSNRSAPDSAATELEAIAFRRSQLYADKTPPRARWGLAFSGGGIRSATFNLGVLQALAKTKFVVPNEPPAQPNFPLLARFDYLSTVSGGGYVGSFYSAMFRVRAGETATPSDKAHDAYQSLQIDPPGRLGMQRALNATPTDAISRPVQWLRENGRYLAPNNSGDLFTDIAIALRNLCAMHYVIGISLLTLFLLMFAFRHGMTSYADSLGVVGQIGIAIESAMQPSDPSRQSAIWWSPWFGMAGLWTVLMLVPLGVAYWLDQDTPRFFWVTDAFMCAAILLLAAIGVLYGLESTMSLEKIIKDKNGVAEALLLFIATLTMAIIHFVLTKWLHGAETNIFRMKITRSLSQALMVTLVLFGVGAIETGGQSIYLWILNSSSASTTAFSVGGVIAALVAIMRQFAPMLSTPSKMG